MWNVIICVAFAVFYANATLFLRGSAGKRRFGRNNSIADAGKIAQTIENKVANASNDAVATFFLPFCIFA